MQEKESTRLAGRLFRMPSRAPTRQACIPCSVAVGAKEAGVGTQWTLYTLTGKSRPHGMATQVFRSSGKAIETGRTAVDEAPSPTTGPRAPSSSTPLARPCGPATSTTARGPRKRSNDRGSADRACPGQSRARGLAAQVGPVHHPQPLTTRRSQPGADPPSGVRARLHVYRAATLR